MGNKSQPNVLVIMSDDLGYEVIGCNGGTSYATPRLDELADTGMRFENAHVMPLCTPTRIALMTGKYNFRNYIGFGLLAPEEQTFGHLFSSAGYKTCVSGKWQLYSYNPPKESPENRSKGQMIENAGFDEFCIWHAHHTEEKGSRYKNPVIFQNGEYLKDTEGKYGEDIFADYIIDFAKRNADNPWFTYWPMALTHGPLEPTPDSPEFADWDPHSNKARGGKTWDVVEGGPADNEKFYKDMVEYHDKLIGQVVDRLEQIGQRENTLIIYLGDNGSPENVCDIMHPHLGEICGGKGRTNDRGTHVPLICNWPNMIPPSIVQHDLIDNTDYLPTIMEAAGIDIPPGFIMDGRSFYPQLTGKTGNPRDWIFFHFEPMNDRTGPGQQFVNQRFIRDHRWKLYEDGRLFDLKSDLEEEEPWFEEDDNSIRGAAREKLEPVFSQMVT